MDNHVQHVFLWYHELYASSMTNRLEYSASSYGLISLYCSVYTAPSCRSDSDVKQLRQYFTSLALQHHMIIAVLAMALSFTVILASAAAVTYSITVGTY